MQTTVLMCIIGALFGGTVGIAQSSSDYNNLEGEGTRLVSYFSKFDEQFDAIDLDRDNALSRFELEHAGIADLAGQFERVDANHDSKITRAELLLLVRPRISS